MDYNFELKMLRIRAIVPEIIHQSDFKPLIPSDQFIFYFLGLILRISGKHDVCNCVSDYIHIKLSLSRPKLGTGTCTSFTRSMEERKPARADVLAFELSKNIYISYLMTKMTLTSLYETLNDTLQ